MKQTILLLCLSILFLACSVKKQTKIEVKSINYAITTTVEIDEGNNLFYSVKNSDNQLIKKSALGINIDSLNIGHGVEIVNTTKNSKDEAYPWIGNQDQIHNLYNEIKIELKHINSDQIYFLEVRNYNNGVAFRYVVPSEKTRKIYDEYSTFNLPEQTKVWYASGPFQYGWLQEFQERDTKDISGELLAPPATFKLKNNGGYMAITEGSLYNYHGGVLLGKGPNTLQMGFVENKGLLLEGKKIGLPDPKHYHTIEYNDSWQQTGTITTPWRIITYGKDLNDLVNNNIVSLVNPAPDKSLFPKGSQTPWVRPGKSLWTWLTERHQAEKPSLKTYLNYVDYAGKNNIEYVTIDEGWYKWKDGDKSNWDILSEITAKGEKNNVGIWVWKSSSERVGIPGLDDPEFRKEFFLNCKRVGVKGVKVDFFHTENFYTVDVMEQILIDAAKNQLLVVFHGVNKPTGESRTYPNLLAKEAVRGLECVGGEDTWAPGPPWTYHNTVLPFVRLLVGPADYTPMHFGRWQPKGTTMAHQMASPYIFTSPMMFFAADPEDIEVSKAKDFITQLPLNWDKTYVLPQSAIGKIVAIARKKDGVWHMAILNGKDPVKTSLKLDFLDEGDYTMEMMTDNHDGTDVVVSEKKINSKATIPVDILSGGGMVIRFKKS